MQWVKKSQTDPVKAVVHATRSKQMVLIFFDGKGLITLTMFPRAKWSTPKT
jgi:hypothetical protein